MRSARLVLWLTGVPCAGKSTVAALAAEGLTERGVPVRVLDGDVLRRSASADLDFSPAARVEQARRTALIAEESLAAGELPIVAIISPSREARAAAREILGDALAEIHVDAPLEVCEARDVKGMYARARRGELSDFTGVSAPYEPPDNPALRLDTARETAQESARRVVEHALARLGDPVAEAEREGSLK